MQSPAPRAARCSKAPATRRPAALALQGCTTTESDLRAHLRMRQQQQQQRHFAHAQKRSNLTSEMQDSIANPLSPHCVVLFFHAKYSSIFLLHRSRSRVCPFIHRVASVTGALLAGVPRWLAGCRPSVVLIRTVEVQTITPPSFESVSRYACRDLCHVPIPRYAPRHPPPFVPSCDRHNMLITACLAPARLSDNASMSHIAHCAVNR